MLHQEGHSCCYDLPYLWRRRWQLHVSHSLSYEREAPQEREWEANLPGSQPLNRTRKNFLRTHYPSIHGWEKWFLQARVRQGYLMHEVTWEGCLRWICGGRSSTSSTFFPPPLFLHFLSSGFEKEKRKGAEEEGWKRDHFFTHHSPLFSFHTTTSPLPSLFLKRVNRKKVQTSHTAW